MAIQCDCHCDSETCRKIVKICNLISGGMLISLGVLRFVFISQANSFLDIILSIYYMYLIYLLDCLVLLFL